MVEMPANDEFEYRLTYDNCQIEVLSMLSLVSWDTGLLSVSVRPDRM